MTRVDRMLSVVVRPSRSFCRYLTDPNQQTSIADRHLCDWRHSSRAAPMLFMGSGCRLRALLHAKHLASFLTVGTKRSGQPLVKCRNQRENSKCNLRELLLSTRLFSRTCDCFFCLVMAVRPSHNYPIRSLQICGLRTRDFCGGTPNLRVWPGRRAPGSLS